MVYSTMYREQFNVRKMVKISAKISKTKKVPLLRSKRMENVSKTLVKRIEK